MTTKQTIAPATLALSVADFKPHARIDIDDDDTLIEDYINGAIALAQQLSQRQFITATYAKYLDCFPSSGYIWLLPSPVQSVSSVKYIDTGGNLTTWDSSNYDVDTQSPIARICPAAGVRYPATSDITNAVVITFIAGYGDEASDVPAAAKQVIRWIAAHLYENREPVGSIGAPLPLAVDALLSQFAVYGI